MAKLVSPMAQGQTRGTRQPFGKGEAGWAGMAVGKGPVLMAHLHVLICTLRAERARWPPQAHMLLSAQFTGGICETLGGFPPTHPKCPCACGWLWPVEAGEEHSPCDGD